MSCKVASIRLETNWNDDEWPDVVRVSHVYTPGNWREYVGVVRCRDCANFPEERQDWWCPTVGMSVKPDSYCMWGERR